MKRHCCRYAVLAVLLLHAPVVGASVFELHNTRAWSTGGAPLLSDASAVTLATLPVAMMADRVWKIDLSAERRFELADLDQAGCAVAHRRGRVTLAAAYAQFGDPDLYHEQTVALSGSLRHRSIAVGATWSAMAVSFGGGYESLDATTVGLSVSYWRPRLQLAFRADRLTEPTLYDGAVGFQPRWHLSGEWQGPGDYCFTGRVTLEAHQKPQFGLGQRVILTERTAIYWGIATAPLTCGGGIDIMYRGGRLTCAVSYHPTLGLSHGVSLAYTFGGKRNR